LAASIACPPGCAWSARSTPRRASADDVEIAPAGGSGDATRCHQLHELCLALTTRTRRCRGAPSAVSSSSSSLSGAAGASVGGSGAFARSRKRMSCMRATRIAATASTIELALAVACRSSHSTTSASINSAAAAIQTGDRPRTCRLDCRRSEGMIGHMVVSRRRPRIDRGHTRGRRSQPLETVTSSASATVSGVGHQTRWRLAPDRRSAPQLGRAPRQFGVGAPAIDLKCGRPRRVRPSSDYLPTRCGSARSAWRPTVARNMTHRSRESSVHPAEQRQASRTRRQRQYTRRSAAGRPTDASERQSWMAESD
jgi:hypothetical protein